MSSALRTRILRGTQPSLKFAGTRYVLTTCLACSELYKRCAARTKFADLSEYGYGVAILSESKYGFSCQGNVLRISLLRAATAPDADQDQGGALAGENP